MTSTRRATDSIIDEACVALGADLVARLERARATSWSRHGRRITFYLPGMVRIDDRPIRYPAISITGKRCELGCDHCSGRLLESMAPATTPASLVELARRLEADGALGMLVSGGSDCGGRLPWGTFIDALKTIKETTRLRLSVHTGLIDLDTARAFASAGVDAALLDIVGSDDCLRRVFHLDGGVAAVEASLDALVASGCRIVPHVIIGLEADGAAGEERAVELVAAREIDTVSFVVFMPMRGTPMASAAPPEPKRVAGLLAFARERMPDAVHALGCARPRTRYGDLIEAIAVLAGVNRIAVPTDGAVAAVRAMDIEVTEQETCCSIDYVR